MRGTSTVGWDDLGKLVLDTSSENVLTHRIQLSRLSCLGHLSHMTNTFATSSVTFRSSYGFEGTTCRSTENMTALNERMYNELGKSGAPGFLGWIPENLSIALLEMLNSDP